MFGGTKTGISGPTGPMAVAMAVVIANHAGNDIAHALTIVVLAGFIQILMGVAENRPPGVLHAVLGDLGMITRWSSSTSPAPSTWTTVLPWWWSSSSMSPWTRRGN